MKRVAIVIDKYKEFFFRKALTKAGYTFKKYKYTKDTILLKVRTDDIAKLSELVREINLTAIKSKHGD